jgi:tRNA threonylcarbamoyladenosine biosynthesis protein TsaE
MNAAKLRRSGRKKPSRVRCLTTRSAQETHELGVRLGHDLSVPSVVLLRGDLGTGKTTLTRGIAEGLGVRDPGEVSSPSFALVHNYRGRCPIYHVDLYRLNGTRDLYTIGLDECLTQEGVTIIEWSERLTFPVPAALSIDIEDAGGDSRVIRIECPDLYRNRRTTGKRP